MNSLSWLLYFAGIAGPLSNVLTNLAVLGFVLLIVAPILAAVVYVSCSMDRYDSEEAKARKSKIRTTITSNAKKLPKWAVLPVIFAILGGLIPPKETLYLIAASEVGENVVTSPTMGKAIDALNRLLDGVAVKRPPAAKPA